MDPDWLSELPGADQVYLRSLRDLLRDARHENLVLPVVGSGLSQPALPGWAQLLEQLIELLPTAGQAKFREEPAREDMLLVASLLVRALQGGAISLWDHLARTFGSEALRRSGMPRPRVHDCAAALGPTQILTTNYDPWIHAALADRIRMMPRKLTPQSGHPFATLDPGAGSFVLYLHGDADDPPTCVLTQEQYDGLQFDGRGYVEGLSALCLQRRLLFLGHSVRDPDLAWVLQRGRALLGSGLRHFLIGFDLGELERERLVQRGIAPIQIGTEGQYERLEEALLWLAKPTAAVHAAPNAGDRIIGMPIGVIEFVGGVPGVAQTSKPAPDSGRAHPSPRTEDSPFPGLRTYSEDEAHLYFGREEDAEDVINELSRRLDKGHMAWVQIEGASGMGKSSLAQAGILPLVRDGRLDQQAHPWLVAYWRPGVEPLRALALVLRTALQLDEATEDLEERLRSDSDALRNLLDEQLTASRPHARLLLLADQLEELFTLHVPALVGRRVVRRGVAAAEGDLPAVDGALAAALVAQPCRLVLLTTIRRDFQGELQRLKQLDQLLPEAFRKTLLPVKAEVLEAGMRRVAAEAGLDWSPPDLPATLAREAAELPIGLPLLAVALEGLWSNREPKDGFLRAPSDMRPGFLGRALGERAEEVFQRVAQDLGEGEAERRLRGLFLALVRPGQGTRDTRRLVPRSAVLRAAGEGAVAEELLILVSGQSGRLWPERDGRPPYLVTVGSTTGVGGDPLVELAHERLLEDWQRLKERWLPPHRERLAWRDQLDAVAELWRRDGARPQAVDIGPLFDRYVEAGSTQQPAMEYVRVGQRRRRRRRILRGGRAAALVLSPLWLSWMLWREQHRNDLDARIQTALRAFETPWRHALMSELREAKDPTRLGEVRSRWLEHLALEQEVERRAQGTAGSAEERWRRESAAILATFIKAERGPLEDWLSVLSDLPQRWEGARLVEDSLAPSYDLYPLFPPEGALAGASTLKFALVGSGAPPEWVNGQWAVRPETAILFVYLPGGTCKMGSPPEEEGHGEDEEPQHEVPLDGFYMALHECTDAQWSRLAAAQSPGDERSAFPKLYVDWKEAAGFCESLGLRLPTEAQWEYACRAGEHTRFWSGESEADLDRVGWYGSSVEPRLHPVGEKPANKWGLFDVHGNVWEWCRDGYGGYDLPVREGDGERIVGGGALLRVYRGGSFGYSAEYARSAYRADAPPEVRGPHLGFRPAKDITPP